MRLMLLAVICLISVCKGQTQYNQPKEWIDLTASSNNHLKRNMGDTNSISAFADSAMQKMIKEADGTFSLEDLTNIVKVCEV